MSIPPFWGSPRKQGLRSNSALFWAPEKAWVRQPLLILFPTVAFGIQSTLCCVAPQVGVRDSQSTLCCVAPRVGVRDSQSTYVALRCAPVHARFRQLVAGAAPEDWGPFEVFDELQKTPFRPRKRKQGHAVEVEDGGLLGFAAFKDLPISFEEEPQAKVHLNIQDLWVVPKTATRHADIGDVLGWVGG